MQQLQISEHWSTSKMTFFKCKYIFILTILNTSIALSPLNMHISIEIAQYGKDINFLASFSEKEGELHKKQKASRLYRLTCFSNIIKKKENLNLKLSS